MKNNFAAVVLAFAVLVNAPALAQTPAPQAQAVPASQAQAVPASQAQAVKEFVDCRAGGRIQPVIDASSEARPLTIEIRGLCPGLVQIRRDGVTIQGPRVGLSQSAISGGVEVYGARRLRLSSLRILDGSIGIQATGASDVFVTWVFIARQTDHAVAALNGSSVRLFSTNIRGTASQKDVVSATNNSTLHMFNTEIRSHPNSAAIGLYRQSSAELRIHNRLESALAIANPARGLVIRAHAGSSALLQGPSNFLQGNVHLSQLSDLEVRQTSIQGNFLLERMSVLQLGDQATITGTARLRNRSMLQVDAAATGLNGAVQCSGESVAAGPGASALNAIGCVIQN